MSTEVIFILIGAVLILMATGLNSKSGESSGAKIKVPIGILGILLIIYGGYSFGAVNLQGQIEQAEAGNALEIQYPIERIQVISPIEGDFVKCRILTMGVYPESSDKDIWVILKPSNEMYYPQSDHTNTSFKRNGEWQVITRFGGDKDELYEIIVYETDAITSEFFSNTIDKWKKAETYPGLSRSEVPDGAVEVDRIAVQLQESCRGVF